MARHALAWTALAGLLVLVVVAAVGQAPEAAAAMQRIGLTGLALMLGLTLVAYGLRFVKWHLLLRRQGHVALHRSATVFTAGLLMSLSPGKVAELWKAWAIQSASGVPAARIVPVVLVERMSDLAAVAALAALGVTWLDRSLALPAAAIVLLATTALLLNWRGPWRRVHAFLARRERTRRAAAELDTALQASARLLRAPVILPALLLGLAAWALEGLVLWSALDFLGTPLPWVTALAVFSVGTLAGVASFLPGGLVATEAGLLGLLVALDVPLTEAAAATVAVRVATLWFGAVLGAGAFGLERVQARAQRRRRTAV